MTGVDMMDGLKELMAENQVVCQDQEHHYLGNSGMVTVYPQTEDEISNVLKYANDHGKKIVVASGETKRGYGGHIQYSDILLSLSKYKGVIEHTVGDMTITVKAGTPFQELQSYLATHNQMIALDARWMENATIGGIIAANDSGPKRLGYGSARDSVIGMRLVYPDGKIIRSGGKVVKNVAGYDMNKLFIGSMGTLAILSEITLKLRPIAKKENVILLTFEDSEFEEIRYFATSLLDSKLEPISLELLNRSISDRLTQQKKHTLAISFEDVASSVDYQVESIQKMKPKHCGMAILQDNEATSFWQGLSRSGPNGILKENQNDTFAALKIGVKNLDVLLAMKKIEALHEIQQISLEAHGGLGHGICSVYLKGSVEEVEEAILQLRAFIVELGGYVVATHLPFTLRQRIDVYGDKPAHFFLFEGIKAKVDPNNVLNYKRFVGGL
ncbi:FAD-binding oxidoreductase [Bacillus sp. JJ722]|uniref:FAD-binding oxidoreductase n=1 Tax=Bacillus sp. JJ722 TaxID=3122973 RepID=UPI002FFFAE3A